MNDQVSTAWLQAWDLLFAKRSRRSQPLFEGQNARNLRRQSLLIINQDLDYIQPRFYKISLFTESDKIILWTDINMVFPINFCESLGNEMDQNIYPKFRETLATDPPREPSVKSNFVPKESCN